MSNMRKIKVILLLFLSMTIAVSYVYANVPIGQVNPDGKAYTLIGKAWSELKGIHPVISGSEFKTLNGKMSFIFKDGTRIEVGEMSKISTEGKFGIYNVILKQGKMSFVVPQDSSLTVKTSDYMVVVKHDVKSLENVSVKDRNIIGGIFFDGNKGQIVSISGTVYIKNLNGTEIAKVSEGSAVQILAKADGQIIVLPAAGTAIGAGTLAAGGAGGGEAATGLLSIMPIAQTSTYKMISDQLEKTNTASPIR
jgi:hypothetical protein